MEGTLLLGLGLPEEMQCGVGGVRAKVFRTRHLNLQHPEDTFCGVDYERRTCHVSVFGSCRAACSWYGSCCGFATQS